jgi:hypothetical protein
MIQTVKAFRFRAFVTFLLTFSFLLSALSGIILFLRPEGSLANWVGWNILGVDKKQWEGIHAIFVFLFLLSGMVHFYLNLKPLLSYLRGKQCQLSVAAKSRTVSQEFIAVLVLVSLIFIGSLCQWSPFKAIVDLRSDIKSGRYVLTLKPPQADTERLTIAELCAVAGISKQQVLSNAESNGVQIGSLAETIDEVARKNRLTPEKVVLLLKGN